MSRFPTPSRASSVSIASIASLASAASIALLGTLCASAAPARTAVGYPPAGEYLIDSEAVTTMGSGPTAVERTEKVVGASGERSVSQRTALDGASAVQVHPGDGPVGRCVEPHGGGRPPPAALRNACETTAHVVDPRGSASTADCRAMRLQDSWRRIDATTWERSFSMTARAGASAESPRGAIEMALAAMPPEQRRKVRAELAALPIPDRVDSGKAAPPADGVMAPAVEALEAQVRSGDPEQAAFAGRQLDALRGGAGSGAGGTVTRVRERWTRVADSCTARR